MVLPGLWPLDFRGLQTILYLQRSFFFENYLPYRSFHHVLCIWSLLGFHHFLLNSFLVTFSETGA